MSLRQFVDGIGMIRRNEILQMSSFELYAHAGSSNEAHRAAQIQPDAPAEKAQKDVRLGANPRDVAPAQPSPKNAETERNPVGRRADLQPAKIPDGDQREEQWGGNSRS